jgi:hypothetical protein
MISTDLSHRERCVAPSSNTPVIKGVHFRTRQAGTVYLGTCSVYRAVLYCGCGHAKTTTSFRARRIWNSYLGQRG